ncbi:hypothetical protein PMAYCL1PPCAC_26981, partial [Pristionchus mayeri]
TSINKVDIDSYVEYTDHFECCAVLLHGSTIGKLIIGSVLHRNQTISYIIKMAERLKDSIHLKLENEDNCFYINAAFITQLNSLDAPYISLKRYHKFGFPRVFWETFFNEKLEWLSRVCACGRGEVH